MSEGGANDRTAQPLDEEAAREQREKAERIKTDGPIRLRASTAEEADRAEDAAYEILHEAHLEIRLAPNPRRTEVLANGRALPLTHLRIDLDAKDDETIIEMHISPSAFGVPVEIKGRLQIEESAVPMEEGFRE